MQLDMDGMKNKQMNTAAVGLACFCDLRKRVKKKLSLANDLSANGHLKYLVYRNARPCYSERRQPIPFRPVVPTVGA